MRLLRLPGFIAYAAMAMWLLVLAITPARAEGADLVRSRLGDHVEEIRQALVERGAPETAKVTLAAPDMILAREAGKPLGVESVSYNPATGRFLLRVAGAQGTAPLAVAGLAATPVLLPVPARRIERNETIGEEDIDWVEFSDPRADAYVADADDLIGRIARRPLIAGTPLRSHDIASPTLIRKGSSVTVVLEAPGIRLSQAAVALASGGEGDLIAFRNINSSREIKAVVVAEGLARAPFRPRPTLASIELDR